MSTSLCRVPCGRDLLRLPNLFEAFTLGPATGFTPECTGSKGVLALKLFQTAPRQGEPKLPCHPGEAPNQIQGHGSTLQGELPRGSGKFLTASWKQAQENGLGD